MILFNFNYIYSYVGGDGSSLRPFDITTCEELYISTKSESEYFILTKNMNCVESLKQNSNFYPESSNWTLKFLDNEDKLPNLKYNGYKVIFEEIEEGEEVEIVPKDLFDIEFRVYGSVVNFVNELRAIGTFENFGYDPTPVNYSLVLVDFQQTMLKEITGSLVVETNELINFDLEEFKDVNLSVGLYDFIFITNYGDNVTDKFSQSFRIIEGEEKQINMKDNLNIVIYIVSFMVFVFILFNIINAMKSNES